MESEGVNTEYAQRVGGRLRSVRKQKGLSLQDVEAKSSLEFKASVLGAYERGERAISVPRLQRLARFYSVPVDRLLPDDNGAAGRVVDLTESGEAASTDARPEPITIDLTRLSEMDDQSMAPLQRFVTMIQLQRQDYNGRVLTVRREDMRALACLIDVSPDGLRHRLDELGLRASV
jgi:transcriptional regulator with XRE-family HTH domain